MTTFWQDIRYAFRTLGKSPGFTAVALLTVAFGIGANTAIFTIVYGVLLRPLPYPDPDRIVQLALTYQGGIDEMDLTSHQWVRLQDYKQPFAHLAAYAEIGFNLTTSNEAERVRGLHVSADYFHVFGVQPAFGRDFLPTEDQGSGQRVALISHSLWVRRFGADPALVGKTILLNGEAYTLIGVMPAGFRLEIPGDPASSESKPPVDVWAPLALVARTVGSGENLGVIARLAPGVSQAQLRAQMKIVTEDFRREFPGDVGPQMEVTFLPYRTMMGAEVRPALLVLLGAIGFVLLIACANVANLLLARGVSRSREVAIRMALGASRLRLFRQWITESLLLALAGGALGLLLAGWSLDSLVALAPVDLPRATGVHLDRWAFEFTFLVSLLTGALFGLAPALGASKTNFNDALKRGEGRANAAPGRGRLRQALVIGEMALSLVLLAGAGLLIKTFATLVRTDPGFDPQGILTMHYWMIGTHYSSSAEIAEYNRAIVKSLESLPGVERVGVVAAGLPLERGGNIGMKIAGRADGDLVFADYREVSPGYFQAMGIQLRQGRGFVEADSETASPVAVVNEAFARKYFPGGSALGEHLWVSESLREIVGVVRDVKSHLDRPAPATAFVPAAQASFATSKIFEGWYPRSIVVRSSVDPLSLSRAVKESAVAVDPQVPTGQVLSMEQVLSRSLALRHFVMVLLSLFAGLALLLAGVGIYGVISYGVAQRTREIGVRMALGAKPEDVLRMVIREGLALVVIGAGIGIVAALGLARVLASLLHGVSATDPLVFVLVTALLAAISLAACTVPARRAMRLDPMVALRYE